MYKQWSIVLKINIILNIFKVCVRIMTGIWRSTKVGKKNQTSGNLLWEVIKIYIFIYKKH
jgi:hypothetical protein